MQNKKALEILLDALSDAEWEQLKLLKESKSAFSTASMIQYRKQGAIQFADWILKHTIMPGYDEDGAICWVIANGSGETLSSPELYNEYMNGRFIQPIFEEDEDE
jgi:hypothetical protein